MSSLSISSPRNHHVTTGESELNGRSGVIAAWDGERGRYDVRLANRTVRT